MGKGEFYIIEKSDFPPLVGRLLENYQVIAPRRRGGRIYYGLIGRPEEAVMEYRGNATLPPKRFFLPEKEVLFTYEVGDGGVVVHDGLEALRGVRRIFLGIRPCDIRGLLLLDRVLAGRYHDPYYIERRRGTIIVGLTCNEPGEACFCAYVGGGPGASEGYDLLLTDLGDRYLAEVGSEKGRMLVKLNLDLFQRASEPDVAERERILTGVERRIREQGLPELDGIYEKMVENYGAGFWEDFSSRCMACGKCNFVCPTCRCFDVRDIPYLDMKGGARIRVWDSCHFLCFTRVTSGHVFRRDRPSRVKQRIYHRLCYSFDETGGISCVGCGRCVRTCPAGIDIREAIRRVMGA